MADFFLLVSKKPYEVIYDQEQVTTKSSNQVDSFYYDDWIYDFSYSGRTDELTCFVQIHGIEESSFIKFQHSMFFDSFVIENLPAESNEKCGTRGLEGKKLRLWGKCREKMIVRHRQSQVVRDGW